MQHTIIPPREPGRESTRPPMIYVEQPLKWEYKQIVRDLGSEQPLSEAELNELGDAGWELTGITQHESKIYFYFKHQTEK
jgi:hypothetical protein